METVNKIMERMGKSKLLGRIRREIRRRNYSYRTEQAYLRWIIRFVKYHDTRHPAKLNDDDIRQYLNYLANERNVAAGTQNQALSAPWYFCISRYWIVTRLTLMEWYG